MPDRRQHRGAHPEDGKYFSSKQLSNLRAAALDLCWLMSRGYKRDSALKLVGDRYGLHDRQRKAVGRSACSDEQLTKRLAREVTVPQLPELGEMDPELSGQELLIDGYNVLTTIEAALAGGVILSCRDGSYRDLASMSGCFRKVEETVPALKLLEAHLARLALKACTIYLDQPVSNSGRLRKVIESALADMPFQVKVELLSNPDRALLAASGIVASADSQILDGDVRWYNLARQIVALFVPKAWLIDLDPGAEKGKC